MLTLLNKIREGAWTYIRVKEGSVALVFVTALKRAHKQIGDSEISVCPSQQPHHAGP